MQNKEKYKEYSARFEKLSVFNDDTEFNGNLSFKNPVLITGRYKGSIDTESELIISEGSRVEADIRSKVVILEGVLTGDVEASEMVDILPTGKLYGNITTAKLKIADGVIFEGTCRMIKK
ncbi:MAG: polymer-forming cytoskeletal protein [Spirochaetes bacterium]|nr:polymer-forming cytoskeletal protein [Spirochaetota bacterium]